MSVDWAFAHAVEALQLTRGPQVISLKVEVERSKWEDQCDEDGCRRRNDDQGKRGCISGQQFSVGRACRSDLPLAEFTNSMLNVRL